MSLPAILDQFHTYPPPKPEIDEIKITPVDTYSISRGSSQSFRSSHKYSSSQSSSFSKSSNNATIISQPKNGPMIIKEKRWYYRLVQQKYNEFAPHQKYARALLQDYPINKLIGHMVVCFTPKYHPITKKPFVKLDGEPMRLYAYFDCYLDFYEYYCLFPPEEQAFYEIIFGELPQKPHFDIDIDREQFEQKYPGIDIDDAAIEVRNNLILACQEILAENNVILNINRDVLIYDSHGPNKRSFHVIINNKCHDGNKEAHAFFNAVIGRMTSKNNRYTELIDTGVYNPRQQFRLLGCQKLDSGRPKKFHENFKIGDQEYSHIYTEDIVDPIMKKMMQLYESMVSFTSGCSYIPSLCPQKVYASSQGVWISDPVHGSRLVSINDLPDLDSETVKSCMKMLREKMSPCPFSVKEVRGQLILLKRHGPSLCPLCDKSDPHEKEHPYMYVLGGRVYWHCRRSKESKGFPVGYLSFSIAELQEIALNNGSNLNSPNLNIVDENEEWGFGDYPVDIPKPSLPPQPISVPTLVSTPVPDMPKIVPSPDVYIPISHREQNVEKRIMEISKNWSERVRKIRKEKPLEQSFITVRSELEWKSGL